ncbi:hypothetical protein GRX03_03380 [Halovenus sp. WSH3]|uniref:Uncharacterized protein n=1 Tax=Halovenus carboxidivorans TaxID=2692199 RepID=A0A6B0T611_9EURY|nr:hypothetical protein [Halovenus carboxidivorans]MXR50651.1 hypothetical protein [Halovenus carboxidivorans]
MDEITTEMRDAIESEGYEVDDVTTNRDKLRISIRDPEASGEVLRELTYETLAEEDVLGFNVTTESTASGEINTVVSFRYRG